MSEQKTVHIIGAGVAGLTAAVHIADQKPEYNIKIYESSNKPGGRCYSFYDKESDRILDNSPHLVLGINKKLFKLLEIVGGMGNLTPVDPPFFPFVDIKNQKKWVLQPSKCRCPFWIFYPPKRVPDSSFLNYLSFFKLARLKKRKTVEEVLGKNKIYETFWLPFCKAVLNTHPSVASAKLLYKTILKVFCSGGKNSVPYLANKSLKGTLIDPIMEYLAQRNVEMIYSKKVRGLGIDSKVDRLFFEENKIYLGDNDAVILALTAENTFKMLPSIKTPKDVSPIICVHYMVDKDFYLPEKKPFYAIVGGISEWVFAKKGLLSVVISAPRSGLLEKSNETLAELVWAELLRIPDFPQIEQPMFRVVKEKNATILHTDKNEARRKKTDTEFKNLFLAGDWTKTGIPSSIESAVVSGFNAGDKVLKYLS